MSRMNSTLVETALTALGQELGDGTSIEVLLVGGAAGMLTGVFPPTRTTLDCDVMLYTPRAAAMAVEIAAETVAGRLGLPVKWFNGDVQMRLDALPDGWERRKLLVGEYGRLRVMSISRKDLIAMKVLAGRAQDIEDLRSMRVRADERAFVRTYLATLPAKGTTAAEIADAGALLDGMETDE